MGTEVLVARRRRRIAPYLLGASALILVGSIAFGIPTLTKITAVASGYFAKQLCSEVFVAGRAATTVVETDLRYFFPAFAMRTARWSIDADAGIVRASFLGLGARAARFRAGAGCALDAFDPGNDSDRTADTWTILSPSSGASTVAPQLPWAIAPARNDRLHAIIENAFIERSEQSSAQSRTRAIIVVHEGRLIAERYADGFDAASRFPGWSIAKSITHAMVGVLVAEGALKLDDPLPLPEWKNDNRRSVTWDQMLRMTSGLAFDESYANPLSDINYMLWLAADAGRFAATLPLTSPPGVMWRYTSGTTNVLTRAIRGVLRDTGGKDDHLSWRAMFDRIGMRQSFNEMGAALGLGADYAFNQDVIGAKIRLAGDLVYGAAMMPAIAVGAQYKNSKNGAVVRAIGAKQDNGVDYYVSASKLFLSHSILASTTLRATKANQLGLLGFGGDEKSSYSFQVEGSLAWQISKRFAIGGEYRTKPDNLGIAREDDWFDVFGTYAVTRNLTVAVAYTDLGSIATVDKQRGALLSLQAAF